MRRSVIALFAAAGMAALSASAARAHGGHGYDDYGPDDYGYGGGHYPSHGWYAPGPVTDGYYGRPRFFRGWGDRVSGYDNPYNLGAYYPYGGSGYLPDTTGPYQDNRGYGVEGRGWQVP
jgi:hypothetical protein